MCDLNCSAREKTMRVKGKGVDSAGLARFALDPTSQRATGTEAVS